jgi:Protein of unknown function (DUF1153)
MRSMRWTANRKKAVLAQIAKGTLTEADACKLYATSQEELLEWRVIGIFASKTPRAIRKTKPRPRKSHAIPTLVPPQAEAADD